MKRWCLLSLSLPRLVQREAQRHRAICLEEAQHQWLFALPFCKQKNVDSCSEADSQSPFASTLHTVQTQSLPHALAQRWRGGTCFRMVTKKPRGPWAQLSPSDGSQSVPANSQVTAGLANNAWHRNVVLITPSELPATAGTESASLCHSSSSSQPWIFALKSSFSFTENHGLVWVGREIKDYLLPSPLQWAGIPWQFCCASPTPVQQIGKDSGHLESRCHHCKFTEKGLGWGHALPQTHHSRRAELIKLLSSISTNNIPCKTSHHHLLA